MSDLARELETATALARRAGGVLLRYFRTDLQIDVKAGDEPVTEADRQSEAVVLAGLREAFPDDGILSEEQADTASWAKRPRAWVVDPLDGTKDFVHRREGYSVMIGLLVGARPVLGVVHHPATGLTYRGRAGLGATLLHADGREDALRPSTVTDPAQARLVASRSHRDPFIDEVKATLGIDGELNVGSVGLKMGLIARDLRDLYLNPAGHCRLWDTCGPEAILTAAGGRVTDLRGAPLRYAPDTLRLERGIVATNGACHDAVVAKLASLRSG